MKQANKYGTGVLAACTVAAGLLCSPQTAPAQTKPTNAATRASGSDLNDKKINAIPIDQLVVATCRQAWHMGGENEDAFFDIVERLTALSAHNRGVTIPDDKSAGSRAGEWIRTQALKDPDQLLYAVVDHAVVYSVNKGAPSTSPKP